MLALSATGCDRVFGLHHIDDASIDHSTIDAPAPYAAAVLADEPVAYWRFGPDSTSVAVDETGHGNTGTYGGGVMPGATGALVSDSNTAIAFDGIDDCVTMGDRMSFEGMAAFTLEAWVNPTKHLGYLGVLSKDDESAGGNVRMGYHLYSQFSVLGFERNDGVAIQDTRTGALPLNTWTHVAVTYDGSTSKLFVDAALQMMTTTAVAIPQTSGAFTLGARNGCAYLFFAGLIDEVAVYDHALTAAQIDHHRIVALQP